MIYFFRLSHVSFQLIYNRWCSVSTYVFLKEMWQQSLAHLKYTIAIRQNMTFFHLNKRKQLTSSVGLVCFQFLQYFWFDIVCLSFDQMVLLLYGCIGTGNSLIGQTIKKYHLKTFLFLWGRSGVKEQLLTQS